MGFGTYFFSELLFLLSFRIYGMLLEYYTRRFYQCHQIQLLCDRQELACTPIDPPRRADMKEVFLISFRKNCYQVIDKTV